MAKHADKVLGIRQYRLHDLKVESCQSNHFEPGEPSRFAGENASNVGDVSASPACGSEAATNSRSINRSTRQRFLRDRQIKAAKPKGTWKIALRITL